jgi:predicted XRE-type DNA-binding protein
MTEITRGSGNVFADLGFKDPETHLLKAELVRRIGLSIKAAKFSDTEVSKRTGMPEPEMTNMLRGQFRHLSLEMLIGCLIALGQSVTIEVGSAAAGQPSVRVTGQSEQRLA